MKVVQKASTLLLFSNTQPPVYSNFRHLNGWLLTTGLTVHCFLLQADLVPPGRGDRIWCWTGQEQSAEPGLSSGTVQDV